MQGDLVYQQAVLMNPSRLDTALALLNEHFARVSNDTGCEFGELMIHKPQFYRPGIQILNAQAQMKKPMIRASFFCSDIEGALMEGMWATRH